MAGGRVGRAERGKEGDLEEERGEGAALGEWVVEMAGSEGLGVTGVGSAGGKVRVEGEAEGGVGCLGEGVGEVLD